MRILFLKKALAWPRSTGHDVLGYHLMRALGELGVEVGLATVAAPAEEAQAGLHLAFLGRIAGPAHASTCDCAGLSGLRERFRSYYGVERCHLRATAATVQAFRPDAVVAVGLDALPYLAAVNDAARIWYAADEWVLHHTSQVRPFDSRSWSHVRAAAVKGLYERAYAPLIDRAWVVSSGERAAMRWLAGVRATDVLPTGVDSEYYRSAPEPELPRSAVFWGRLDFGPNVQALDWFCRRVWPLLRREAPDARFTIIGFHPSEAVRALARQDGLSLVADLSDLRPEVSRHALVALPFVSGGGIKNKLLEAASLGKPIVCTPRACGGLHASDRLPLVVARRSREWVRQIRELWADGKRRQTLGAEARRWVLEHHTWQATAECAIASIERCLAARSAA